jgi:hypothetical protein
MAANLGLTGIYSLNMGYQLACTTGTAPDGDGPPLMRRVLDWGFPGLGKGVEIVWQRGSAGDFHNISWPGAAGVLTAAAAGRFCAAINQAPLYRRTQSRFMLGLDFALNLRQTLARETGWPPDHLLRNVFEDCVDYRAAVDRLSKEPLARPAVFSIVGMHAGETAVIERTEREFRIFGGSTATANAWQKPDADWEPRAVGADPRENNRARVALMQAANAKGRRGFDEWVRPPILNRMTRLAVEMSARPGDLMVQGYEPDWKAKTAHPATLIFDLSREVSQQAA